MMFIERKQSVLLVQLALFLAASHLIVLVEAKLKPNRSDVGDTTTNYTNHVVAYEKNSLGFEKLEEYLQDELGGGSEGENDFLGMNMKAAQRLMTSELEKPAESQDTHLLKALKLLSALDNMSTCNHVSYELMADLKMASKYAIDRSTTSGRSHARSSAKRRIELIMSKYALNHALKCKAENAYSNEFRSSYTKVSKLQLDQIDAFMQAMIDSRLKTSGAAHKSSSVLRRLYSNFMDKNDSFKSPRDAELTLRFMMNFNVKSSYLNTVSKNAGDFRHQLIREMADKHIISPCRDYLELTGRDMFIPAQWDSRLLDRSNRYKPSGTETRDSFIYGWVRFGFCTMLIRDQSHLVKKMISMIPSN